MKADLKGALRIFNLACDYMNQNNLRSEIEWQRNLSFQDFTETDFLRESAWVILCSGFREKTVRCIFNHISLCFCDWESAAAINNSAQLCHTAALASFRNPTKLNAIIEIARRIYEDGFSNIKESILRDPIVELQNLPHIGPITVWHLAKNLGLDVAKPDRHLVRVANHFGFKGAEHFCYEISKKNGEKRNVIDLVVWRYLADNPQLSLSRLAS